MQARLGGRRCQKALGGAQDVEAGAEAGLADHEGARFPPVTEALAQPVAVEEDVHGLGAAIVDREVHIAVIGGLWCGVVPLELRLLQCRQWRQWYVRHHAGRRDRLDRARWRRGRFAGRGARRLLRRSLSG